MLGYTIPQIEGVVFRLARVLRRELPSEPTPLTDAADIWREVVCCILSSQVPYPIAQSAARYVLKHTEWMTPICSTEFRRVHLAQLLSQPFPHSGSSARYRFPNTAAKRIAETAAVFCKQNYAWNNLLHNAEDPKELRRLLMSMVTGFGPKQASMFLRNTGISWSLAILDKHVLSYMSFVGLVEEPTKSGMNLSSYEMYEDRIRQYASDRELPVGILDYTIWILMQEAKKG